MLVVIVWIMGAPWHLEGLKTTEADIHEAIARGYNYTARACPYGNAIGK